MKKFLKERNPILLVSFVFSIIVFIYDIIIFSGLGELINNITIINDGYDVTFNNLVLVVFAIILIMLLLFIPLFIIIGYLYKKEEYIIISILLLIVSSFMFAFSGKITISFIAILWCIINVIGLMKKNNN